jgi:hypothetical protein
MKVCPQAQQLPGGDIKEATLMVSPSPHEWPTPGGLSNDICGSVQKRTVPIWRHDIGCASHGEAGAKEPEFQGWGQSLFPASPLRNMRFRDNEIARSVKEERSDRATGPTVNRSLKGKHPRT